MGDVALIEIVGEWIESVIAGTKLKAVPIGDKDIHIQNYDNLMADRLNVSVGMESVLIYRIDVQPSKVIANVPEVDLRIGNRIVFDIKDPAIDLEADFKKWLTDQIRTM